MAISQGFTRGFQRTPSAGFGFSMCAGRVVAPGGAGNAAAFSDKSVLPKAFLCVSGLGGRRKAAFFSVLRPKQIENPGASPEPRPFLL
jgi:hypothetical protein